MRRILLCVLVALYAGCAQRPPLQFDVPDADSRSAAGSDFPGQATVYLLREDTFPPMVITAYVDEARLGSITDGYYRKAPVPPGKRAIALRTPAIAGVGGFVIHATFQPDRTYYFCFEISSALVNSKTVRVESLIRQVTPEEAPRYLARIKDQETAPQ